jgi:hypothetical protein
MPSIASSIAPGQTVTFRCTLPSDVTVTPGAACRVSVQSLDGPSFPAATITSAKVYSCAAGDVVNITAIDAAATYSGDVRILTPDGGVVALSNVVPEVLATASAGSTALTGAGLFAGYRCTTATGNITIYDNTAASGKVLVPTTALTVGSFPIWGAGSNWLAKVTTGVHVVLSGAAVVYVGVEAD